MADFFRQNAIASFLALTALFYLSGCAGANISSQARESGGEGSSMMLRCTDLNTNDEKQSNKTLKRFDGWKMVYVSEYTTPNKLGSAVNMCFERPYSESLR